MPSRVRSCESRLKRSERVRERLGPAIAQAADLVYRCAGSVIVTGMGKAGLVGQKLAATLASTGTRAFPLHPGEAIHGDLGRIRADDVVIALSQSGETEEVLRLVPALRRLNARLIAITERLTSSLGQAADLCIALGPIEEACPLGLAPSASTTALMAVGDALALLVSRMRDFSPEDFALYHPGGSLGRKLTRVEDVMRTGRQLRRAHVEETVREIFVRLAGPRRRSARSSSRTMRATCWVSLPTATWPGCSRSAGRRIWTARSARS